MPCFNRNPTVALAGRVTLPATRPNFNIHLSRFRVPLHPRKPHHFENRSHAFRLCDRRARCRALQRAHLETAPAAHVSRTIGLVLVSLGYALWYFFESGGPATRQPRVSSCHLTRRYGPEVELSRRVPIPKSNRVPRSCSEANRTSSIPFDDMWRTLTPA